MTGRSVAQRSIWHGVSGTRGGDRSALCFFSLLLLSASLLLSSLCFFSSPLFSSPFFSLLFSSLLFLSFLLSCLLYSTLLFLLLLTLLSLLYSSYLSPTPPSPSFSCSFSASIPSRTISSKSSKGFSGLPFCVQCSPFSISRSCCFGEPCSSSLASSFRRWLIQCRGMR